MTRCPPWLRAIIRDAGGQISFERFMREALYHPSHGYYAARVGAVGHTGDFSTSATLCPAFGEALAHWAAARAKEDFASQSYALVEIGAGSGQWATSFLAAWRALAAPAVPYIAVETSPRLRKALAEQAEAMGFSLASSTHEAFTGVEGRALVFSNELPDAFPARQLVWQEARWHEVFLALEGEGLAERPVPFTDRVDVEVPGEPREGQHVFIHPAYHAWLKEAMNTWRAGRWLTIDYGSLWPSTGCRAYCGQERREGVAVYDHVGGQDLTCDVNFSDLRRWGEGLGAETVALESQAEWLAKWLPDKSRQTADPALTFLAEPLGAGGAFQVLEQRHATNS